MWSTATIEIHPYKDPCHRKNCMIGHFVSETGCIRHLSAQAAAAGPDYLEIRTFMYNPCFVIPPYFTTIVIVQIHYLTTDWLPWSQRKNAKYNSCIFHQDVVKAM